MTTPPTAVRARSAIVATPGRSERGIFPAFTRGAPFVRHARVG